MQAVCWDVQRLPLIAQPGPSYIRKSYMYVIVNLDLPATSPCNINENKEYTSKESGVLIIQTLR